VEQTSFETMERVPRRLNVVNFALEFQRSMSYCFEQDKVSFSLVLVAMRI
jgi:hypothetical protein